MVDIYNYLKPNLKLEIIYTDKSKHNYSFSSKILTISEDRIFIEAPSYNSETFDFEDRDKIKIILCTEYGTFSGYSAIISKDNFEEKDGYWITFPYNNQYCQRREYVRVPMHVDFSLVLISDEEKKEYNFKTKNVSGKGLSFNSDFKIENFDRLICKLNFPESAEHYEHECDLIYSQKIFFGKESKYSNALTFSDISTEKTNKLVKTCFKFQLNQRRNEKLYSNI